MLWQLDPQSSQGLSQQVAANVRRGITDGELVDGDRLPTATDLARTLGVNPNTVLVAFRGLRDEGLLEFRRGRGVRVRVADVDRQVVTEAARRLLEIGRTHGYTGRDLADLIQALSGTREGST